MTCKDLIEKLQKLPQEAEVLFLYDGAARGEVEEVWLAQHGNRIILSSTGEPCYDGEDRPEGAKGARYDWFAGNK